MIPFLHLLLVVSEVYDPAICRTGHMHTQIAFNGDATALGKYATFQEALNVCDHDLECGGVSYDGDFVPYSGGELVRGADTQVWLCDRHSTDGKRSVLLTEDFDNLQLAQVVDETSTGERGEVWTSSPPDGWKVNNDDMGTGGMAEFRGWTFMKQSFWQATAGDQTRSQFQRMGNIAIADSDEFHDKTVRGSFNSWLTTKTVSLKNVDPHSVLLTFASTWKPHAAQTASIKVQFDDADPLVLLKWDSLECGDFFHPIRESELARLPLPNPKGAETMTVSFGLTNAGNDWWWGIDDVEISGRDSDTGDAAGVPPPVGTLSLLHESFEGLELQTPVHERSCTDKKSWTAKPPSGWSVDNRNMATGGMDDFRGWTFMLQDHWQMTAADQERKLFGRPGAIAVADSDEFHDRTVSGGRFNSWLNSPDISLPENLRTKFGLVLTFDSSWRPDGPQEGQLVATWSNGDAERLMTLSSSAGSANYRGDSHFEQLRFDMSIPNGAKSLKLGWGLLNAGNNWWWAIDNIALVASMDINECAEGSKTVCKNNGKCVDSDEFGVYKCNCDNTGHGGQYCEADIDECKDNTSLCGNGGACKNTKGDYSCNCEDTGFQGTHCDEDVNECSELGATACSNNGVCTNTEGSYSCNCADTGYTGDMCTEQVDECETMSPCMHSATCTDTEGSYSCNCADTGYIGKNCEVDIDECDSEVCMNGATCVNKAASFKCVCAGAWTGLTCSESTTTATTATATTTTTTTTTSTTSSTSSTTTTTTTTTTAATTTSSTSSTSTTTTTAPSTVTTAIAAALTTPEQQGEGKGTPDDNGQSVSSKPTVTRVCTDAQVASLGGCYNGGECVLTRDPNACEDDDAPYNTPRCMCQLAPDGGAPLCFFGDSCELPVTCSSDTLSCNYRRQVPTNADPADDKFNICNTDSDTPERTKAFCTQPTSSASTADRPLVGEPQKSSTTTTVVVVALVVLLAVVAAALFVVHKNGGGSSDNTEPISFENPMYDSVHNSQGFNEVVYSDTAGGAGGGGGTSGYMDVDANGGGGGGGEEASYMDANPLYSGTESGGGTTGYMDVSPAADPSADNGGGTTGYMDVSHGGAEHQGGGFGAESDGEEV